MPFDCILIKIAMLMLSSLCESSAIPVDAGACTVRKSSMDITRWYGATYFGYLVATPCMDFSAPSLWQSAHALPAGPFLVHRASACSAASTAGLLVGSRLSPK